MKNLIELRKRKGLTLRQVQDLIDVSNSYLSQMESGKIKNPSAKVLYGLSKIYGTTIEEMLIGAGMVDEININADTMPKSIEERLSDLEKKMQGLRFNQIVFGPPS